jgi:hypothetical protein
MARACLLAPNLLEEEARLLFLFFISSLLETLPD